MTSQILGFDIAWGHFDVAWPKLWHKNGVLDQNLGCSSHFDVASEKWAPVALKIFYRYASTTLFRPLIKFGPLKEGSQKTHNFGKILKKYG